jgi:hypothetical protein
VILAHGSGFDGSDKPLACMHAKNREVEGVFKEEKNENCSLFFSLGHCQNGIEDHTKLYMIPFSK